MTGKVVSSLVFFVACLFLAACAVNPVTGQKEFMLVSEQDELKMGSDVYPNAMWGDTGGGGEYRDEQLKAYLKGIVLRIHEASHRPNLPVDFAVQNSSVPNAWAIPGHVVITRGLLSAFENDAQFAFVLGHEMGHVSAKHSARQMTSGMLMQAGLSGLGVALGGRAYSDLALNVGAIGGQLLMLKYSREHELEADRLGIEYMSRLGYDPKHAVSAHQALEKIADDFARAPGKEPHEKSVFDELLATHPRMSVRIDEIQSMTGDAGRYSMGKDKTSKDSYQNNIANIRRINKIYIDHYDPAVRALQKNKLDEADGQLSKAIALEPNQAPFYTLKGFIFLKKKEHAEAEKHFNTALKIDDKYEPALRGKGTVGYFRGEYEDSVRYLKNSIALFPQDISAHHFLGMSYYKMRMHRQAVPHLRASAQAQPKHPEIHGVLGICYENTNNINAAYNEYAIQLKVAPDNELGRHAAARISALRLLMEAPRIRR